MRLVEIWCLVSHVELQMMVLITSKCTSYSIRINKRMKFIKWQNKPYTLSSLQNEVHLKKSNKQNRIPWVFLCLMAAYLPLEMVYQLLWNFVHQANFSLKMTVNHVPLEWVPSNPRLPNASRVTKCGSIQEMTQTQWNTSFRPKFVKTLKQSKTSNKNLTSKMSLKKTIKNHKFCQRWYLKKLKKKNKI